MTPVFSHGDLRLYLLNLLDEEVTRLVSHSIGLTQRHDRHGEPHPNEDGDHELESPGAPRRRGARRLAGCSRGVCRIERTFHHLEQESH